MKQQNYRTSREKPNNLDIIRNLIEYSLNQIRVKTTFALTVFEILLLEARLVLEPAQRVTGTERVNISVKTKINVPLLLEMFLVFSSIITEVIRPVLNFFFFFTIRFHKCKKAFFYQYRLKVDLVLYTYVFIYLKASIKKFIFT